MTTKLSQWLESKKQFKGYKPGKALATWLNGDHTYEKFVCRLLMDAQYIFSWTAKFNSIRKLTLATKSKKLPPEFWECS